MLAGQVNGVVAEIQHHFIEREVGKLDALAVDDIAVAVIAT
jgi:hypothetical protein